MSDADPRAFTRQEKLLLAGWIVLGCVWIVDLILFRRRDEVGYFVAALGLLLCVLGVTSQIRSRRVRARAAARPPKITNL